MNISGFVKGLVGHTAVKPAVAQEIAKPMAAPTSATMAKDSLHISSNSQNHSPAVKKYDSEYRYNLAQEQWSEHKWSLKLFHSPTPFREFLSDVERSIQERGRNQYHRVEQTSILDDLFIEAKELNKYEWHHMGPDKLLGSKMKQLVKTEEDMVRAIKFYPEIPEINSSYVAELRVNNRTLFEAAKKKIDPNDKVLEKALNSLTWEEGLVKVKAAEKKFWKEEEKRVAKDRQDFDKTERNSGRVNNVYVNVATPPTLYGDLKKGLADLSQSMSDTLLGKADPWRH